MKCVLICCIVDNCLPVSSFRYFDRCYGRHTIFGILNVHLQSHSVQAGLQIRGGIFVPANNFVKSFLRNASQCFTQTVEQCRRDCVMITGNDARRIEFRTKWNARIGDLHSWLPKAIPIVGQQHNVPIVNGHLRMAVSDTFQCAWAKRNRCQTRWCTDHFL